MQKKTFPISFTKGVDTGTDAKLVIPSKFTTLDNLELDKVNSFRQRPGYTAADLTAAGLPVLNVNTVRALHALGSEIILEASSGMHLFLRDHTVGLEGPAATVAGVVRAHERAQVDYSDIGVGIGPSDAFDVAVADPSGLECWVWSQHASTLSNVYYKIVDRFSGSTIQQGLVSTGVAGDIADQPRVIVTNIAGVSTFYIYFRESNAGVRIRMRSLAIASSATVPSAISTINTVVTLGVASNPFDVCYGSLANKFFLAYRDSASTFLAISVLASDGFTVLTTTTDPGAHANPRAVSITATTSLGFNYGLAVYHLATAFLYSFSVNAAGTAIANTTLDTPAPDASCRIAVLPCPFVAERAIVFYDHNPFAGLDPFQYDIKFVRCVYDGSGPTAVSTFARGVSLATRPAVYDALGNGALDICVAGFLRSTIQSTVFLFKVGGTSFAQLGFDSLATHVTPRIMGRLFSGGCGDYKNQVTALTTLPAPMAVV